MVASVKAGNRQELSWHPLDSGVTSHEPRLPKLSGVTRTAAIHAFLGFHSSGTVPTADSATHGASMSAGVCAHAGTSTGGMWRLVEYGAARVNFLPGQHAKGRGPQWVGAVGRATAEGFRDHATSGARRRRPHPYHSNADQRA